VGTGARAEGTLVWDTDTRADDAASFLADSCLQLGEPPPDLWGPEPSAPVATALRRMSGTAAPAEVLRTVFGFPAFRGLQEPAIDRVMAGGDALVLMPTGGGKSVCYQIPALCREGMGVVVSPLIALMDDQVAALRQLGIRAAALHSELDAGESQAISRAVNDGALDLLYVSPERLLAGTLLDRLAHQEIALIAIDEAHCVSQWGHEFRPDYRQLNCLPQRLPGVPRIALTATADARTRGDILASLAMPDAEVFTASFHRPNLHIAAEGKIGETAQLQAFLAARRGQTGIVYAGTRARTDRVAAKLREKGYDAIAYHAGLAPADKREALRRFRAGDAMIMVATIAFGMGIDRPDVRFVVHLDMPDSPEAYYQQIGRAGRDGAPSHTLLLYGGEDIARARHFLAQSAAPERQQKVMRDRLETMVALTETAACRTGRLLSCFGEELGAPCGHCDNCLTPPTMIDGTEAAQKVLSAVYRTNQIFGAVHIVNVLRGEATDLVRKHRHDGLALFGIGRDRSANFWRGAIRQLIAHGALTTTGDYASLALVQFHARPLLRGEQRIMLRAEAAPRPNPAPGPAGPARPAPAAGVAPVDSAAPPPSPQARDLFEVLRVWRAEEAKQQKVPAYVIFHDAVLQEIAARRPRTRDELAQIKGVGASKLDRYAAVLLAVIEE
jgi:ATP-dependent DNA helicase RecQ